MRLIAFLLSLMLAPQAFAAAVVCSTYTDGKAPSGCAATVSNTSAAVVLGAGYGGRSFLMIDNEAASGGNPIACTFDGSTPAINTAGSITLAAATRIIFQGVGTPGGVITCIAGTGATAATFIAE